MLWVKWIKLLVVAHKSQINHFDLCEWRRQKKMVVVWILKYIFMWPFPVDMEWSRWLKNTLTVTLKSIKQNGIVCQLLVVPSQELRKKRMNFNNWMMRETGDCWIVGLIRCKNKTAMFVWEINVSHGYHNFIAQSSFAAHFWSFFRLNLVYRC